MKIRFSHEDVRIRITYEEFEKLARGEDLALEVPLPPLHVFRLEVRAVADGGWMLASDSAGLRLSIPESNLIEFAQALPSRKGLTCDFPNGNGKDTNLVFEVDLKS